MRRREPLSSVQLACLVPKAKRLLRADVDLSTPGLPQHCRTAIGSSRPGVRLDAITLPSALNLSHNTAFTCSPDGRNLVAYGGRRKHLSFRDVRINERGIHVAEGRVQLIRSSGRLPGSGSPALNIAWSPPRLVLDGSPASGCVERRTRVGPACEFDGKLSVVNFGGRTLLFARANVAECGGRHVQVTWSADGLGRWSRWQLLRFSGALVRTGELSSNIYYFAVRAHVGRLVAFFPAVFGDEGGVYAASSNDGVHWTTPSRLLASDVLPEWRTADYPVDGAAFALGTDRAVIADAADAASGQVSLLVEQGAVLDHGKALLGCVRPPILCAYNITLPADGAERSLASSVTGSRGLQADSGRGGFCAAGAAKIALVMRGEAFRWGCSKGALDLQLQAALSYVALAERLEASQGRPACARFFVAIDNRACPADGARTKRLLGVFGRRLAVTRTLNHAPADQGKGAQLAMRVFADVAAVDAYELLVFGRLDLRLLSPSAAPWSCAPGTVCAAAQCEAKAWGSYRCVSDVFFLVSRPHVGAFVRAVGSSHGASRNPDGQCGCFDATCPHRGFNRRSHGSGHDCFNVLARSVGAGAVSFAWPQVALTVAARNPDYALPSCDDLDASSNYTRRACPRAKLTAIGFGRTGRGGASREWQKQRAARGGGPSGPKADKRLLAGGRPSVAVCLSGQLRVMVRRGLHRALRTQLADSLGADVFVHVDHADTRQWGTARDRPREEFDEVVRVLRPAAAKLESYTPPPVDRELCGSVPGDGESICEARDCGTFTCGCYTRACTHCVVSQYVPQHRHTQGCLDMIERHEQKRGARYDLVVKTRPDLNVTRPITLAHVKAVLDGEGPPAFCVQGGLAPSDAPAPLESLPLTLDDKFALLPRAVAAVYMNATKAFVSCQTRAANDGACSAKGLVAGGRGGPGGKGGKFGRLLRGGGGGEGRGSPYWSTPQCVLKRHLLAAIPNLRMVDCLGRPAAMRLIRPETSRYGRAG